jgi:hypothetical protein
MASLGMRSAAQGSLGGLRPAARGVRVVRLPACVPRGTVALVGLHRHSARTSVLRSAVVSPRAARSCLAARRALNLLAAAAWQEPSCGCALLPGRAPRRRAPPGRVLTLRRAAARPTPAG